MEDVHARPLRDQLKGAIIYLGGEGGQGAKYADVGE